MHESAKENWGSGGPYEQYVGRWSRKVAREFLGWLTPTYLATLNDEMRDRIRDALRARVTAAADGSIAMTSRAWAVQGTVQ